MKINSKSLQKYCEFFIKKYVKCKTEKAKLCQTEIIDILEKYILDNNIKNILDIESSNIYNLNQILKTNKNIKYLGTYMKLKRNFISDDNISYCNLNLINKDDLSKYDLILVKNHLEYLSHDNIIKFINNLKHSKIPVFIITKKSIFNIDAINGLYKYTDLNKSPLNLKLNIEIEYYNKEDLIIYISVLTIFIYLSYKYKYKLYFFIIFCLILYGYAFPKYVIYKL